MQVSVIIPCHNAAAWLRETLTSVFVQADAYGGGALEVIVVDDGSTDESAALVAREFPQVELIRTENRGASHARNRGLEHAHGEWIQFLDADDVLGPGKIAAQCAVLQETGAEVAYGDWQYLVRGNDGAYAPAQPVAGEIRGTPEIALFTGFWAPLCAYLFRRSIVDAVGGFEVSLPIFQDAHFVLAAAMQNARFVHVPGISSYYRIHAAQISRNRTAFLQDGWTQFLLVREAWQRDGVLTPERRAALIHVLGNLARTSFEPAPAIFDRAYGALKQLEPHYVPAAPRSLRWLSLWLGYPRAERVACSYRRVKRKMQARLGRAPAEPIHPNVPHS